MLKIKTFFKQRSNLMLFLHLALYGLTCLILASFIFFLFFLYQRFYLTLTQAEEIIVLKSQLAVETLDLDLFAKIKKRAEKRRAAPSLDWSKIKNPFSETNK
ncbi:MAG: hypothetical protein HY982_00165 [Candidatus Magasanikbacteria bacterium]|nr:hypothetical protein [Candidatus Magasanikbacteria bacterium]